MKTHGVNNADNYIRKVLERREPELFTCISYLQYHTSFADIFLLSKQYEEQMRHSIKYLWNPRRLDDDYRWCQASN